MIIGLTSGCFDLIHVGHIHYLQRCKNLCDRLIVGVDSDNLIRSSKGEGRPIIPEMERLELIRSLNCVDSAFIINELSDLEKISISFDVAKVFKHEGFKKVPHIIGVEGTRAELEIVPDIPGLRSTTSIIEKIWKIR